jgi:hydroxyethylthiazole kinase-like uncharacterized protein yjeF
MSQDPLLMANAPTLWLDRFPWPAPSAHKHERGRLVVASGGPWQTGAARLAARAGLRVGAGVVTILSPPDAMLVNAAHLEAIMLRQVVGPAEYEAAAETAHAAVIGPAMGVGEATIEAFLALARTGAALVVDADALTSFSTEPARLFTALDRDDVLTPHAGELERLFPGLLKGASESTARVAAARTAAARAGAIVLLKGPQTVVAAPDGRALVNDNGAPWLATAGSGDVLAGLIGGLMAQGMESLLAAAAAVWIHAEAGARFGPGLIAEDIPGLVPTLLAELFGNR